MTIFLLFEKTKQKFIT